MLVARASGRWTANIRGFRRRSAKERSLVVTEAEFTLFLRPKARGLLVPHSIFCRTLDALATCLEFQPSAVELMDSMLIRIVLAQ